MQRPATQKVMGWETWAAHFMPWAAEDRCQGTPQREVGSQDVQIHDILATEGVGCHRSASHPEHGDKHAA